MEEQKSKETMRKFSKKLVVRVAEHYANVSCPLIVYQPKMSDSVKKLRRF